MTHLKNQASTAGLPRWTGWLLNAAYTVLLVTVSPWLLYQAVTQGKYRRGWSQKLLGRLPRLQPVPPGVERYWFHAVSVGEVLLLRSVIEALRRRDPSARIVISTTTSTGHAVALERFPDTTVCYFPLDFTWAVHRAIRRIRPTRFVLVELELWPNLLAAMGRSRVPVSLINGRLSERSFRGYLRVRKLLGRILPVFDRIAVQNETYAHRFCRLGATPDQIAVTGSVKFDGINTDRRHSSTQALRTAFGIGPDQRVFIAGSTQFPEEQTALAAWQQVRSIAPDLRLILVPRHQERFEQVADLVTDTGLPLLRRSHLKTPLKNTGDHTAESDPVLLLDTLGELSACWGLADFAFVGGSLTDRGGQNMIEPAGFGAAVCFGPNTRNFRETVDALLSCDAATVVTDAESLAAALTNWILNPATAAAMGQRAQQFVLSQRGATERTLKCLCGDVAPVSAPLADAVSTRAA